MDARTEDTIPYGPGDGPWCEAGPVGTHWSHEPATVAGYTAYLALVAEDLADGEHAPAQRHLGTPDRVVDLKTARIMDHDPALGIRGLTRGDICRT